MLYRRVVPTGLFVALLFPISGLGADAPKATLTMAKGYEPLSSMKNVGHATYRVTEDIKCKRGKQRRLNWASIGDFEVKAQIGHKVFVEAESGFLWISERDYRTMTMASKVCKSFAGFTIQPGADYQIVHVATEAGCRLTVVETASGKAPDDLQFFDSKEACPGFMLQGSTET